MLRKRIIVFIILFLTLPSTFAQEEPSGLILNTDDASEGYTLFAPLSSTDTYLIDNEGRLIHSWNSEYRPGNSVYLLENGNLLRTATVQSDIFTSGGIGGRVEEFTWDGELVWEFEYAASQYHAHHDIERLPNGNILLIAWEYKSAEEALAAGRDPDLLPDATPAETPPGNPNTPPPSDSLWPEHIIEIDPTSNEIVWEWHVWDHLVQDYDGTKANYGVIAQQPELININFTSRNIDSDWLHINSIDYNPQFDQIVLSVHNFSEIWIIDHSTTTAEAAGHSGGRYGKGGDLLYRWGNPQVYDSGSPASLQLFSQHDAKWIAPGLPGAGNILIFSNGHQRRRPYSSIEEIVLPVDEDGNYSLVPGTSYGPPEPIWTYSSESPRIFFSPNISGSQRLPNGNTLICEGASGRFFEVTPQSELVWEYINPVSVTNIKGELMNAVFRAEHYDADYPGLSNRDLTPGKPLQ
jgi:hypothetical protein